MSRNKITKWHSESIERPCAIWISAGRRKGLMKVNVFLLDGILFDLVPTMLK